jgi:glycosyltransferase involved in cell wall biosynthesis
VVANDTTVQPSTIESGKSAYVSRYSHLYAPRASGRVKLLLLIRDLRIGGAERQLVTLAKNLDRTIFDVAVVCTYNGGVFAQELRDSGVPYIPLAKRGRWDLPRFLERFVRVLRSLKPDIVHSYLPIQNLLALVVRPVMPAARVVWGVRGSNTGSASDWLSRPVERLQVLFSSLPDLTIFNSNAGREDHLSSGFMASRTLVIPNGIDTKRFVPDRASGLRLRALWHVPDDALLIGVASRLVPMKDHSTFLRAAASFAHLKPDVRYVCVGAGPEHYSRNLRAESYRLGLADKVAWLGSLDDMSCVYNAFDICCSSSRDGEGTSNSIAEAMACGVPCVVTDVGDSSQIVGDTGIVVPPRNHEALAAGWAQMHARMAENPRLRETVRQRVNSQFSLSALVHNTSEAFLSIL